jgi:hypothetical protein
MQVLEQAFPRKRAVDYPALRLFNNLFLQRLKIARRVHNMIVSSRL